MDWLSIASFGANLSAVAAVLLLVARGHLVARSWADNVVRQANLTAEMSARAAESADRRADAMVQLMTEQTAALRAVESLVRALQGGAR